MNYIFIDIETCPINKEVFDAIEEEEDRKKLLNPIDSKIIFIGLKKPGIDAMIFEGKEKEMLEAFWEEMSLFRKGESSNIIVGFNIKSFDLPFLVTRSFINDVQISPFVLKEIVDLREILSAFKWGHVRGKLKEFGELMGITIMDDIDGSKIAETYWSGKTQKIVEYLKKDLEITEKIHERAKNLRIDELRRW